MTLNFVTNSLLSNPNEGPKVIGPDVVPLNIIAHVISYLDDDLSSLSRLCRTTRVLYYMALPHLWKNVALRSRSSKGSKIQPYQGSGRASPFSMGLNALVTRNMASLVRSLYINGEWTPVDLSEDAELGRVPESTMMMNIALTAAIGRCMHLESFRWDLDVRPQPNVYTALATLSNLKSLWIRFPSSQLPQTNNILPAMPHLKTFTMTHYDPICHPDDVSQLLLRALKLETLQIHFSSEIYERTDPSRLLYPLFRQNILKNRKIRIAKLGLYNFYPQPDDVDIVDMVDANAVEDLTVFCGSSSARNVSRSRDEGDCDVAMSRLFLPRFVSGKALRLDRLHKSHVMALNQMASLESLYFVKIGPTISDTRSQRLFDNASDSISSLSADYSCGGRLSKLRHGSQPSGPDMMDLYMDTICTGIGSNLKHLILPACWPLPTALVARLIRSCPNLIQVAMTLDFVNFEVLRMILPFLSKLWAIRVSGRLETEESHTNGHVVSQCSLNNLAMSLEERMEIELAGGFEDGGRGDFPVLKYLGVGEKIWEVGGLFEQTLVVDQEGIGRRTEIVLRRKVKSLARTDVMDIDIWKMDSDEII